MSPTDPPVPGDDALFRLAARVGEALVARGWRAATAESCTGGWIAKALTDVPGSSDWFEVGLVTYANRAKSGELHVDPRLIAEHGAVSEPVAAAMAQGAVARDGVDVAVAVSGVAGPGGGSAEKPVGTVWFAWAVPEGLVTERRVFAGDREAVRRRAVEHALEQLLASVAG
jgi:nicotinamide-nucleotide amidase